MSVTGAAYRLSIAGFGFQVSAFSLAGVLTPETANRSVAILTRGVNSTFLLNEPPKGLFLF
jgi:hypothetical protein